MIRKGLWSAATALLIVTVAVVCFGPGWGLSREQAAARAEGLALTRSELRPAPPVPDALNAASAMRQAREAWVRTRAYRQPLPIIAQAGRAIDGKARPQDQAGVIAWCRKTAPNLAQWRAASRFPRVDYGDRAQYRWSEYGIDLLEDRYAASVLVAAAGVGIDPRENLLAAARLSRLMRSEGEIHAVSRGAAVGIECLKVAARIGLLPETRAALGPPTDLRTALRPELPKLLDLVRAVRRDRRGQGTWQAWLDRVLRPADREEAAGIAQWRELWRNLPNDGADYLGAARACDARLPRIMDLTRIDASRPGRPVAFTVRLGGDGLAVGKALRAIDRFERMRNAFR